MTQILHIFSGRLRRPEKIGYFEVSERDFTREIGQFEVSKPRHFPAAKIAIWDPPIVFLGGKWTDNGRKLSHFDQL